jgi:hypothetical protein
MLPMVTLNLTAFAELQGAMNETEMAAHIGVDRSQLWRIKKRKCSAGEAFISKVMAQYPDIPFNAIFNMCNEPN